ncbi:MAG: hypothetical protein ACRC42_01365 [Mycoplasma sp.]
MILGLQQKQNSDLNFSASQKLNKAQIMFIVKACLIGGIGFAMIFGVGYGFATIMATHIDTMRDFDMIMIIASVLLIFSMITNMILLKGKPSYGKIGIAFVLFILSFGLSFGLYFLVLPTETMLFTFAITAGSLIVIGFIGFLIKDSAMMTINRVVGLASMIYFVLFLVGFIMMFFRPWSSIPVAFNMWDVIISVLLAVIIMGCSISVFYGLKKTSEFVQGGETSDEMKKQISMTAWLCGYQIMSTCTILFIYVLRFMLIFGRRS